MNKISDLEYRIINFKTTQTQSVMELIEQAFDFYLMREFFAYVIKYLKNEINLKASLFIEFIIENADWTIEDLIKLKDMNRNDANTSDDEILTNEQWSCFKCTFLNDIDFKLCVMCSNPKGFLNFEKNSIFYS